MSKKILLADDDENFVEVLRLRFESAGYTVVGALDGDEALAKIREENPDVVIADIGMPKIDGYMLVREMKSDDALKDIPIIILTGKDQMQDIFKVEGVMDYFMKPFEFKELLKKIEELLGLPHSGEIKKE